MTTHYSLLGVDPSAPPDEIKRAFRREVARYHPDKVQHLGAEFQEIATGRAAALTEAYRVLMNGALRAEYDAQLAFSQPERPAPQRPDPGPARQPGGDPDPGARRAAPAPRGNGQDDGALNVVRRAVLARLAQAAEASSGVTAPATGFDAAFELKGPRSLFRRAEPGVRVAARIVPCVDAPAVEAAWPAAARLAAGKEAACLLLLGSGLSAAGELSSTIMGLRRKTRGAPPIVIPVDIRDWEALVPPDTPPLVRGMLDRLRHPDEGTPRRRRA